MRGAWPCRHCQGRAWLPWRARAAEAVNDDGIAFTPDAAAQRPQSVQHDGGVVGRQQVAHDVLPSLKRRQQQHADGDALGAGQAHGACGAAQRRQVEEGDLEHRLPAGRPGGTERGRMPQASRPSENEAQVPLQGRGVARFDEASSWSSMVRKRMDCASTSCLLASRISRQTAGSPAAIQVKITEAAGQAQIMAVRRLLGDRPGNEQRDSRYSRWLQQAAKAAVHRCTADIFGTMAPRPNQTSVRTLHRHQVW